MLLGVGLIENDVLRFNRQLASIRHSVASVEGEVRKGMASGAGVSGVTIRVQPGLADALELNVYDLAGRRVHASSVFQDRGAFDDGNGLGPQFTYEHVWDVSGVGSGVYVYAVTARKAGQGDILKHGKVGVVK